MLMFNLAEYLQEGSYYARHGYHEPLLRSLRERIPDDLLVHLKDLAFLMIKPDAVASGKTDKVIEHLGSSGFGIFFLSADCGARPRQFEELYKFNLTAFNNQNMLGAWWLNSQSYCKAPIVSLLVYRTPETPEHSSIHQACATAKGPSSPYSGHAGQLRYDLRACNRALNLLHGADDPLSTAREFLLFHSVDRLARVLEDYEACKTSGSFDGHAAEMRRRTRRDLRCLGERVERIEFLPVLLSVKSRLAASLARERVSGFDAEQLWSIYDDGERVLRMQDCPTRQALRFRDLSRQEQGVLARCGTGSNRSRILLGSLRVLADFDALSATAGEECLSGLAYAGVAISEWEEIVIRTSTYYADDLHAALRDRTAAAREARSLPVESHATGLVRTGGPAPETASGEPCGPARAGRHAGHARTP